MGRVLLLLVVLCCGAAHPATAAVWTVPDDAATISEALAKAAPGDTIVVRAGTYRESLLISRAVTLKSDAGAAVEIVGAERETAVIRIVNPGGTVTLEGLHINGAYFTSACIEAQGARVQVVRNEMFETSSGILLRQSEGEIRENLFHKNLAGEMRIVGSVVRVTRNRFEGTAGMAIQIIGRDSNPVIGGAPGDGNVFGPGYHTIVANETKNEINARYNEWNWSTTVEMNERGYPAEITAIVDVNDNPQFGRVDYRDWVGGGGAGRRTKWIVAGVALAAALVLVISVGAYFIRRSSRKRPVPPSA